MQTTECPFTAPRTGYELPARRFVDVSVNGHWSRVRVEGRAFRVAAGRAAARACGRKPASVVSVRDDGYRIGDAYGRGWNTTSFFFVTLAMGPSTNGITPKATVRVCIDTTNRPEAA